MVIKSKSDLNEDSPVEKFVKENQGKLVKVGQDEYVPLAGLNDQDMSDIGMIKHL